MWANLHLLFWLSLIPVLTGWIGEQLGRSAPAATYGLVCLAAALAFMVLVRAIIRGDGNGSQVVAAIGRNVKPRVSLVFYSAAAGLAFVSPWISYALFAMVAALWFVPLRRLSPMRAVPRPAHARRRRQNWPIGAPKPATSTPL